MLRERQTTARDCLLSLGWKLRDEGMVRVRDEPGNYIITLYREIETAVGVHEAYLRIYDKPSEDLAIIEGHYQSEGQNVLSACGLLIYGHTNIPESIERMHRSMMRWIDWSYARKLFLAGVVNV